ncbi:MAG: 6-phosphogluconolactonase [Nitrospirales bacterium]
MASTVVVCKTQEEVFEAAAQFFCEKIPSSSTSGVSYSIALSGGSTPRGLFRLLAADPYRSQCDWSSCKIFWGDERCVPPDHSDSNFRMAKDSLLDHVPIASHHVFRVEGEREPEEAALRYGQVLSEHVQRGENNLPRFDLVLLGMGPDGHTASLFPNTTALQETKRTVVANWVEKLQTFRITLTPPVLNAANDVVFLVSGQDKALAVQSVLEGPRTPQVYPAQLVSPSSGQVTWMMDQAAASLLTNTVATNWISRKGR